MKRLSKNIIAMGLALALCMNFVLLVRAAGTVCPSCGSTKTMALAEKTDSLQASRPCIHGYEGKTDTVMYRLHYSRLFCGDCEVIYVFNPTYEEMSRMCDAIK